MTPYSYLLRSVMIIIFCLGIISVAQASKTGRNNTFEEVATVWVGVSVDGRSVIRLDLKRDRTGEGGEAFIYENEDVFFKIDSWSYTEGRISIQVSVTAPAAFQVECFTGSIGAGQMYLEQRGEGWKRPIILRRETDLLGPWERLRNSMGQPIEPNNR